MLMVHILYLQMCKGSLHFEHHVHVTLPCVGLHVVALVRLIEDMDLAQVRPLVQLRAGLLEESSIFSGRHRESGELMCAPDLLDFVAREVERDAAVMKQIRKAREERQALAKGKKEKDEE